jgi:hypothetical protein
MGGGDVPWRAGVCRGGQWCAMAGGVGGVGVCRRWWVMGGTDAGGRGWVTAGSGGLWWAVGGVAVVVGRCVQYRAIWGGE